MAMHRSAGQEKMLIPNGMTGDGDEEGITESAKGGQPLRPQVGDGDC
jgi:hypothetical protein